MDFLTEILVPCVILAVGGVAASTCSDAAMSQCVLRGNFSHPQVLLNSSGLFPYYNDAALDQVCRRHRAVEACVSESLAACEADVAADPDPDPARGGLYEQRQRIQIERGAASTGFLCGSHGRQTYRELRGCLASSPVTQASARCNRTFNVHMAQLVVQRGGGGVSDKKHQICRYLHNLVSCLQSAMHEHCGEAAASWIYKMKMLILSPAMENIGCRDESHLGKAAIIGIALSLFIIFIVVVVASVICRRRARAKALLAMRQQHNSRKSSNFNTKKSFNRSDASSMQPLMMLHKSSPILNGACHAESKDSQNAVSVSTVVVDNGDDSKATFTNQNGRSLNRTLSQDYENSVQAQYERLLSNDTPVCDQEVNKTNDISCTDSALKEHEDDADNSSITSVRVVGDGISRIEKSTSQKLLSDTDCEESVTDIPYRLQEAVV